ncbi:DUF3243 domain-containing protein [Pseudalkalibacillus caeni]|uniref:DUF3243 domain-containing protein n=1 Tax=Exobacillus caeni TaxID=2574798 RepID=A0A5R9F8X6_9BACL|nr:DUF3243 domain-containing protein [Pseudalkalibacillus caeni]TLS38068.1 DUF3243 domain-containing protein [Pseudalkalibacillus caeni]
MNEEKHLINKEKGIKENKVDDTIDRMSDERKNEILENFQAFKKYLSEKVEVGEKLGLDEEKLAKVAEKVADYLAANEEPKNREEKLLQELWNAGNAEQQHQLAHLLVRMALNEEK